MTAEIPVLVTPWTRCGSSVGFWFEAALKFPPCLGVPSALLGAVEAPVAEGLERPPQAASPTARMPVPALEASRRRRVRTGRRVENLRFPLDTACLPYFAAECSKAVLLFVAPRALKGKPFPKALEICPATMTASCRIWFFFVGGGYACARGPANPGSNSIRGWDFLHTAPCVARSRGCEDRAARPR